MSALRPLALGTGLSMAVTVGISANDPVPLTLPGGQPARSPWQVYAWLAHHPQQAYTWLASSTFGNGWELFALVAVIMSACLFVWGLYRASRAASQRNEGRAT